MSPADETEAVWIEVRRSRADGTGRKIDFRSKGERTILLRVIDRSRVGSHRTGSAEVGELAGAVRLAIAQSRSRSPLPGLLHLPADESPLAEIPDLYDPAVAELDEEGGRAYLSGLLDRRLLLTLQWSEARIAVFNTRGVRRRAAVTTASLEAGADRRLHGGRVSAAARLLKRIDGQEIVARARALRATGQVAEPPTGPVPVVLSPEATIRLIDVLNQVAFSAIAYYQGSSFLREHLDVQVFDRCINLRDDGTDPAGIPFPFDLEGTAKRPVDLISKGTPKTPALDERQAARMGLEATAHAISGDDARALNLFLLPGEASDEDLLAGADGGLWIGWLDRVECFEPARVQIRARARGIRLIRNGKLEARIPDLIWEESLLRIFSSLKALGNRPRLVSTHDGIFGGFSAPAAGITSAAGFRRA